MNSPGHGQGEVVKFEHLAQVLPAGRTDGPQRITAALQLRHCHILMTVSLQELQGILGNRPENGINLQAVAPALQSVCVVVLLSAYRCVAVGTGERNEFFFCQIFELILLRTHCEDGLWTTTREVKTTIINNANTNKPVLLSTSGQLQ